MTAHSSPCVSLTCATRSRGRLWARLALTCSLLAGCAHTTRLGPDGGFQAVLGREHPLTGKVWSRRDGRFIDVDALVARVEHAPVLLIGETHDHVDHHRLQAWLLARWLPSQQRPAVAFEMLDEGQAAALEPAPTHADELAARVRWADSGWPAFELYRPVFEVALQSHATLLAVHPTRERVRASMEGVPPEQRAALALEPPLAGAELSTLAQEIRDSHCGHASEPMVEAMTRAQNYKDAVMARAIADARRPVALIAGKGHVGEARGVPVYLARQGVADVLTIALVEVVEQRTEPALYLPNDVDLLVFTPRTTDEDPCQAFRAQLEQMRQQPPTR
jgi:uncharacterized iron-regulated protein